MRQKDKKSYTPTFMSSYVEQKIETKRQKRQKIVGAKY